MKKFLKLLSLMMILVFVLTATVGGAIAQEEPPAPAAETAPQKTGAYIVRMIDEPVVAYAGGVPGLKATKPAKNQKINPNSPAVVAYVDYLKGRHNAALNKVGGADKLYDYTYSYNGFSAWISPEQAAALASVPGVMSVEPDVFVTMDTSSTPTFLGLDAEGGLWEQLGGIDSAGEDIIIGIIDSGIWPESLSFSDRTGENGNASKDGKLSYKQIPGWHGKCKPGEDFPASLCNQKLIGAQYFNAGQGGKSGIDAARPWEFNSARDYNGHGTHTASTAGGNANVPTSGPASVFGAISGMAPRARIAMYKALWSTQDASTASGSGADLMAAIDQAVADGVDVINYSISGSLTNFLDGAEVSFLYAADAGVFVAASAGNSGPASSTVAHPSPWITTVAAGTHNRNGEGSVTLGNGVTYTGASIASAVGPSPLVNSTDAGLAGADATKVALCYSSLDPGGNALDPTKVAGKIVVCGRGVTARVNKSLAVKEAGGVGMILVNPTNNSINADFHWVPTVHLNNDVRGAVMAYAATAGATATINAATIVYDADAPFTATFSSRGPLLAGGGDLLKPDVIAPGQDILAAVSPAGGNGLDFNLYSGTSMSSPHVAGLAALLMDLHPDWSPMAVKSALMTTAYDILDGPNTHPLVIFRQGAGHVQPNSAADPGLVFNSSWNNWLAFLCGTTTGVGPATCNALAGMGYSLDPSDMNVASIAIGDLAGSQTVTRTLTNVGNLAATYTSSVTDVAGVNVVVSPSSFTIQPGESKKVTITFTYASATFNAYTAGYITWTDGTHNVRVPVVVKPVALAAPAQVNGTGGPISYKVTFGYNGTFSATPRGLIPADVRSDSVTTDPDGDYTTGNDGEVEFPISVGPGGSYVRFALFNSETTAPDLDLYVFNQAGALVGSSAGGSSDEVVNLIPPTAGANYTVLVHGYDTLNPSDFKLFIWALGTVDEGNMDVTAPTTAVLAQKGDITLTFSGLTPGVKYLGSVAYGGPAGMTNPTIVRVDP